MAAKRKSNDFSIENSFRLDRNITAMNREVPGMRSWINAVRERYTNALDHFEVVERPLDQNHCRFEVRLAGRQDVCEAFWRECQARFNLNG